MNSSFSLPNLPLSHTGPKPNSPLSSRYPAYGSVGNTTRPARAVTTTPTTKAVLPASQQGNPPLVRTSMLPSQNAMSGQAFNPYGLYSSKAILKLDDEALLDIAKEWDEEEWDIGRRLVQFSREQDGNTINATFSKVGQDQRPSHGACISCIYWANRQECYVTSVDTIALLEFLLNVRFTVEEKNRIRRNLEGFRPQTVSKIKADSEEFFKLIMGFPNPKPRNIEKDVKVFPWKILSHALKKIVGKYVSVAAGCEQMT
jgi:hypothetical protein